MEDTQEVEEVQEEVISDKTSENKEEETRDEILARHRKEISQLQKKEVEMKKQAARGSKAEQKAKKRQVEEEVSQLSAKLKEKQAKELSALGYSSGIGNEKSNMDNLVKAIAGVSVSSQPENTKVSKAKQRRDKRAQQEAPSKNNGYLRVRCNGGLNQQRTAISNAVLAARIMNATLVLPELDANSFWHDDSGFHGIYDVEHFIRTLRFDVKIVESIPENEKSGKKKKLKAFQIRPPRDAPISWYTTDALKKMKEHGAIYLTPFSHRLAEEIDNPEYQRLRCRVNYHALRFKPHIMKLSQSIVDKLRAQGPFMSIHLRFEMDMLSFAGCFDIFTPEEQKILKKYREENFAPKKLVYNERRAIGKCPLTPEEVGLILRALGFDNSTRIYLAAGELFGGDRFMNPFRSLFPRLENHSSVDHSEELAENTRGLAGSAVDYMVCLLSDIFMPTYDGPSNFANNLLGHRLYYGFRTTIRPDRKALAPIFIDREKGQITDFDEAVKKVMLKTNFGEPHKRVSPESFYTNSWPECFCQTSAKNPEDNCPPNDVLNILHDELVKASADTNSTQA